MTTFEYTRSRPAPNQVRHTAESDGHKISIIVSDYGRDVKDRYCAFVNIYAPDDRVYYNYIGSPNQDYLIDCCKRLVTKAVDYPESVHWSNLCIPK